MTLLVYVIAPIVVFGLASVAVIVYLHICADWSVRSWFADLGGIIRRAIAVFRGNSIVYTPTPTEETLGSLFLKCSNPQDSKPHVNTSRLEMAAMRIRRRIDVVRLRRRVVLRAWRSRLR